VRDAVEAGGGLLVDPEDAEGLVWANPLEVDSLISLLKASPDIRWVQLPYAGVERFAERGVFGDGRTWTCAKGVYAEPVAEHALALGLAGLRQVPAWVLATEWTGPAGTTLYDGRVTILGGGGITESLIALLRPFRAHVTVVRRSDVPFPGADLTLASNRLHDALPLAHLVVVALALTPETTGIIGAKELALMEPYAWLVNVARGPHVVTEELVDALAAKSIGGAALDVTDPEPLPIGHRLWSLPNCIISPHTVRRFAAGQPLVGPVDPGLGY
jgi:phosphoglycerate dehydrogenase-like enzyme